MQRLRDALEVVGGGGDTTLMINKGKKYAGGGGMALTGTDIKHELLGEPSSL